MKILIEAGVDINVKDRFGQTALICAASNSRTNSTEGTVKMLIEAGADIDAKDSNGYSAITHLVVVQHRLFKCYYKEVLKYI